MAFEIDTCQRKSSVEEEDRNPCQASQPQLIGCRGANHDPDDE
jgi:hypothetical protein